GREANTLERLLLNLDQVRLERVGDTEARPEELFKQRILLDHLLHELLERLRHLGAFGKLGLAPRDGDLLKLLVAAKVILQLLNKTILQHTIAQALTIRHEQLLLRSANERRAIDEYQKRVPQIVLLHALAAKKILAEHRLRLTVVREDNALILPIALGRVLLLVLASFAEEIDAGSEFLPFDVDVELVEPLDVLALRALAVLFECVDEAGHRRIERTGVALVVAALVKANRERRLREEEPQFHQQPVFKHHVS